MEYDTVLQNSCNNALKQYESGQIDEKTFHKEIWYITVKYCLKDMEKKRIPEKPELLIAFQRMNDSEKYNFLKINPTFWSSGVGGKYRNKVDSIDNVNERNKNRLEEMLLENPDDTANCYKIRATLNTHDVVRSAEVEVNW